MIIKKKIIKQLVGKKELKKQLPVLDGSEGEKRGLGALKTSGLLLVADA